MCVPYEYSYFAFDFCLIKKNVCVRKQKSERWKEKARGQGKESEGESEGGIRGVWARSAVWLTSSNE